MEFVIYSPSRGVFMRQEMGNPIFLNTPSPTPDRAITVRDTQSAEALWDIAAQHAADLEFREVASGHWEDLQAADLLINTLSQSDLSTQTPAGSC